MRLSGLSNPASAARRLRLLTALLASGFTLSFCTQAIYAQITHPQPNLTVRVTDVMQLPAALPNGEQLRELSGLAWDANDKSLVGVTDRGLIVRWTVELAQDRIARIIAKSAIKIASPKRVNAESIEWIPSSAQPNGELYVVDEKHGVFHAIGSRGEIASTRSLSAALLAQREPGALSGVEAIAHHPQFGMLAVNQRGTTEDRRSGIHRIFSEHGRQWKLQGSRATNSSIKAMHLLNERQLLLLEKTIDQARAMRYWLRVIDLTGCATEVPCDPEALAISDPRIAADDNFEGLACVDQTHCIVASDDGKLVERRTLLVALQLGARR